MKKLSLKLDLKLADKDKKAGLTPERVTVMFLSKLHEDKVGTSKGQSLDEAKVWARFIDECYDNEGKIKTELEISDEKFDMVKKLLNEGKIPVGMEMVALKLSESLDKTGGTEAK